LTTVKLGSLADQDRSLPEMLVRIPVNSDSKTDDLDKPS
jgi:hypothetical protein